VIVNNPTALIYPVVEIGDPINSHNAPLPRNLEGLFTSFGAVLSGPSKVAGHNPFLFLMPEKFRSKFTTLSSLFSSHFLLCSPTLFLQAMKKNFGKFKQVLQL
jgi:hypothetical protein